MAIPFYRYIVHQVFATKNITQIVEDLSQKGFRVKSSEVEEVYKDLHSISSPAIRECLENKTPLSIDDEAHVNILRHYGILEMYCSRNLNSAILDEKPPYLKWFEDIDWMLQYEDVVTIVNLLFFNGESVREVSSIIQFKYRKKISQDALDLYKKIYWNVGTFDAKEALCHFTGFSDTAYILRKLANGEINVLFSAAHKDEHKDNGYSAPFYTLTSDFIKWKIGYNVNLKAPSVKDFLQKVQTDAMYKYQEAFNIDRSMIIKKTDGVDEEGKKIDGIEKTNRNLESERMKLMSGWLKMFLAATDKMPEDASKDEEDFFDNMLQVEMEFTSEEKIIDVRNNKKILEDTAEDRR